MPPLTGPSPAPTPDTTDEAALAVEGWLAAILGPEASAWSSEQQQQQRQESKEEVSSS